MIGKRARKDDAERVLDVDASMQGTLTFKEAVNLRINGRFEGSLTTKGNLTVSENAVVNADIVGETITIAGKVNGNITAQKALTLIAPACVVGDIATPLFSVAEGAVFDGKCSMLSKARQETSQFQNFMTADELAKYLEIDASLVIEWANTGRLPGMREGDAWRFDRIKVDEWVATEKIK